MVEPISTAAILKGIGIGSGITNRLGITNLPGIGSIASKIFGGESNIPFQAEFRYGQIKKLQPFLAPATPQELETVRKAAGASQRAGKTRKVPWWIASEISQYGELEALRNRYAVQVPSGAKRITGSKLGPARTITTYKTVFKYPSIAELQKLNALVPQPGDPDFVGPVQEQPSQPGKVDKGKVAKTVLKTASNFIRIPRQQRGGSASTGGFGNISELEQEEDRVIPSGFIRKQATTALAPARRNALDTIV